MAVDCHRDDDETDGADDDDDDDDESHTSVGAAVASNTNDTSDGLLRVNLHGLSLLSLMLLLYLLLP